MAEKNKAIVVSVLLSGMDKDEHLSSEQELVRLVQTLGHKVENVFTQKRESLDPATLIGEGKIKELADYIKEKKIGLVCFDGDVSPRQVRKLEDELEARVLDRRGVIVEIFYHHAKTREAKLQVEVARLNYEIPRLKEKHKGKSDSEARLGETGLELDKRRLRDRISEIKKELDEIRSVDALKRKKRADTQTVALVGYTNAGKSSLMRALTGGQIYVADKLFATLDTKVRSINPSVTPPVYVIDTVGFIKNLPHDLVASFRSTLDEAKAATLILFVVDASDPNFRNQLKVTNEVLDEIGVEDVPSLLILNKIDQVNSADRAKLKKEFPKAIQMSSLVEKDVLKLRDMIILEFEKNMKEISLALPFDQGKFLAQIHQESKVVKETHDERGTNLKIKAPPEVIERFQKKLREIKRKN